MDYRHKSPVISVNLGLDPANPLLYLALGVVCAIVAMIVLAMV